MRQSSGKKLLVQNAAFFVCCEIICKCYVVYALPFKWTFFGLVIIMCTSCYNVPESQALFLAALAVGLIRYSS